MVRAVGISGVVEQIISAPPDIESEPWESVKVSLPTPLICVSLPDWPSIVLLPVAALLSIESLRCRHAYRCARAADLRVASPRHRRSNRSRR